MNDNLRVSRSIWSDFNPCTWHLILTSLAPSIAGNTMVTLAGAGHCHIVWNSNNSVIATTRNLIVHIFQSIQLKNHSWAIIDIFQRHFCIRGLLTWHYCFVSATGTGHRDYKAVILPAQLMFCWWLWSPLPLTVEVTGPRLELDTARLTFPKVLYLPQ